MIVGMERGSSVFSTTPEPSDTIAPPDRYFRSPIAYQGTFDATAWTVALRWKGTTSAGVQDGRFTCRIFAGDANGPLRELTTAIVDSTIGTNIPTTGVTLTATWTPASALNFANEYIWIKVGWMVTGAATNAGADINFVQGGAGGSQVTTSDLVTIVTESGSSRSDGVSDANLIPQRIRQATMRADGVSGVTPRATRRQQANMRGDGATSVLSSARALRRGVLSVAGGSLSFWDSTRAKAGQMKSDGKADTQMTPRARLGGSLRGDGAASGVLVPHARYGASWGSGGFTSVWLTEAVIRGADLIANGEASTHLAPALVRNASLTLEGISGAEFAAVRRLHTGLEASGNAGTIFAGTAIYRATMASGGRTDIYWQTDDSPRIVLAQMQGAGESNVSLASTRLRFDTLESAGVATTNLQGVGLKWGQFGGTGESGTVWTPGKVAGGLMHIEGLGTVEFFIEEDELWIVTPSGPSRVRIVGVDAHAPGFELPRGLVDIQPNRNEVFVIAQ